MLEHCWYDRGFVPSGGSHSRHKTMLCRDVIGGLSRTFVADAAIACLSTVLTALYEATTAVDTDVVPHMGDAGKILDGDSHHTYSGTGVFRDTCRASFNWKCVLT